MGSGRIGLLQQRPKKQSLKSSNALVMNVLPLSTGSSIQDRGLQRGYRVPADPAGVLLVVAVGVVVDVGAADVGADVVDFNRNVIHIFYSKTRKLKA